jgi:hypothetical protein
MGRGFSVVGVIFFASSAFAQQPLDIQTVAIGPWAVATTFGDLGIAFMRDHDGLLLALDSPKWKLERGKTYAVRLAAGALSIEAQAVAESKAVTITLADRSFKEKLRTANFLDVHGQGATLRVPLDGSAAALERLDACFEKNSRQSAETNPFVAPDRKP